MLSEKELIETCKTLIGEKIQLPQNHLWKQRDFEYLSELIAENTGTRISVSTLKRIWKDGADRLPQLYTLNALALFAGFESWNTFRKQYSVPPPVIEARPQETKRRMTPSKRVYLLLIPVVLAGPLILLFFKKPIPTEKVVSFKSRKNVAAGVPNTVIFEYDISGVDVDSAFIQHTWDRRLRARLDKANHYQTFIYYYPGYHLAKLMVNDAVLKTEHVNISTPGWLALADGVSADGLPQYLSTNITNNGRLYLSKDSLLKNGIPVSDKNFWISYFNVGDFKQADAGNFRFETRIKNNVAEGGFACQYTQLSIICEKGMISVPFSNPGCVSNIHLHIGEVFKDGKKNDLSPFGIDLSTWRNIKIETVAQQVEVSADNKMIFRLAYNENLGQITGVHFKFYGSGSVDLVKLYNKKNDLCFSDDF